MALIERELKRDKLVAKYAKKHAELKAASNDLKKSDEERAAKIRFLGLPPEIREMAFTGDIPGMIKASW